MQPAPSNTPHTIPTSQNTPDSPNHHHGQHRSDDLQDSPQPHSGGRRGAPGPPSGRDERDGTRSGATSDEGGATDVPGLKGVGAITPPRDRITDYENARLKSPQKPAEGPLFEIVKSNRKPDDKKSPIADFPTGEYTAYVARDLILTSLRTSGPRHRPPLAKRSCCRVSRLAPLQQSGHCSVLVADCLCALLPRP